MSGASRMTFETVITDTPARFAMSLRRTISDAAPAPVQLAAESIEKTTAREMQQPNVVAAAANADFVAGGQRRGRLAVCAEDGFNALRKRLHQNCRVEAYNDRAIREGVRTNRRDGE